MSLTAAPSFTGRILSASLLALAFALPISIAGTNIALAVITAGLLAHLAAGKVLDWRGIWTPVTWCLCLYCAVAVLTAFTGVLPSRSMHNLHKDFHKLWVYFVLLLALRASPAKGLPAAMAAGFVFVAAYGIAHSGLTSYQGLLTYQTIKAWERVHGFVISVTFGEMTALGLLGGLSFLARKEGPDRKPLLAFVALLAVALLLSQTRGALVGVLAGFAGMCAVEPALRRWLKYCLVAAALALAFASLRSYRTSAGENTQFTRLLLWDVAWRIFKDHPWLGVGPSNYATVFTGYFSGLIEGQRVWGSAHNIFLQQLAERGLLGLLTLLAVFWSFLAKAWHRARSAPDTVGLLALAAATAFLVMNLTESAFQNEQISTLFLTIWAYTAYRTGENT